MSFATALRQRGVAVDTPRLGDAANALALALLDDASQVYWLLRCTLVQRAEDLAAFDAVYAELGRPGQSHNEYPAPDSPQTALVPAANAASEPSGGPESDEGHGASAIERLRGMDFAAYGPEERRQAKALIDRIAARLPTRSRRRLSQHSPGRRLDLRSTLRAAARTHGVPMTRVWSGPVVQPRKLLLLLDVSGSMQPYAWAMALFLQSAVRTHRGAEAFAFGTRLTRLTEYLRRYDVDRALVRSDSVVPDWAGGTRIGENLHALNRTWGPRGVTRGAVIVVISDGLECGPPDLLAKEMTRLHLTAHTVIWVNPLAGDARYEPLAAGMAAALPRVDVFLPGHSLGALESLAEILGAVPDHRPRGRARWRGGAARSDAH